jgi:uncharacterized membrane protein
VTAMARRTGHRRGPTYTQSIMAVVAMVAIFGAVAAQFSTRLGVAFVAVGLATLAGLVFARHRELHVLHGRLTTVLMALLTLALAVSVVGVIAQLVDEDVLSQWVGKSPSPARLLGIAAVIWLVNILLFAFWYWELDAGGPVARHCGEPYQSDDLVFPQRQHDGDEAWIPEFLDYLFFAFNSSTAFSPTDTLVMSRRMKVLMMVQSLISLSVLAVVASRAVNALAGP